MNLTRKQKRAVARAPKNQKAIVAASFRSAPQSARPAPRMRQRRPRQVTNAKQVVVRRGFNAFALDKPALAFSVGRATLVRGMARNVFGVKADPILAGQTHMMVIISGFPGYEIGQVAAVNVNTNGLSGNGEILMESAGFSSLGASSSSPDTALTARLSVRLRNISPALEVAGQVYALNMAAGVNLTTPESYTALVRYVENHPRTTTFSAHELRSGRQWNAHPVDQSAYHKFNVPSMNNHEFKAALTDPGMSTIVLVFPVIGNADAMAEQQYELTVQGNYYARYRVTGPLAHAAEHPPTLPLPILNGMRDMAEAVGSVGMQALGEVANGFGAAAFQSLGRTRLPALGDAGFAAATPFMVD